MDSVRWCCSVEQIWRGWSADVILKCDVWTNMGVLITPFVITNKQITVPNFRFPQLEVTDNCSLLCYPGICLTTEGTARKNLRHHHHHHHPDILLHSSPACSQNSTCPTNKPLLWSPFCHKLSHNTACTKCHCSLPYDIQSRAEISSVKLSCS